MAVATAADLTRLPPERLAEVLEASRIELCRRFFRHFAIGAFKAIQPGTDLTWNWHLDLLCEYAEAVWANDIQFLIVNVMPRSLKSFLFSIAFPAWGMGRENSLQFMCGSYSGTLALRHSVECRFLMSTPWYGQVFPELAIAVGEDTKEKFATTKRGHRIAVSVGGSVIGEGADIEVIDDPHNPLAALSDRERVTANTVWLDQTMMTRFNNPKKKRLIVVSQRLHVEDMAAYFISKRLPGTVHVVLQNEAPTDIIVKFPRSGKIITRKKDELLHPERVGPVETSQAKILLTTYGYSGQYQQSPVPLGGGRVKLDWFGRYTSPPSEGRTVISIDTADTVKSTSAKTAIEVYRQVGYSWALIHLVSDRLEIDDLFTNTINVTKAFKPTDLLIENKASGISLIQLIKKNTYLPVTPINPCGDKRTRFEEVLGFLSTGRIQLPGIGAGMPWLFGLEMCLQHYPNPPGWDELDSMSQFASWVLRNEFSADVPTPFGLQSDSGQVWSNLVGDSLL